MARTISSLKDFWEPPQFPCDGFHDELPKDGALEAEGVRISPRSLDSPKDDADGDDGCRDVGASSCACRPSDVRYGLYRAEPVVATEISTRGTRREEENVPGGVEVPEDFPEPPRTPSDDFLNELPEGDALEAEGVRITPRSLDGPKDDAADGDDGCPDTGVDSCACCFGGFGGFLYGLYRAEKGFAVTWVSKHTNVSQR